MADNVTIPTTGTGDATPKVATDQLAGGEHVQFMKVMDGTLDSSNKWLINSDGSASFVGNVASGATDSGNPVKVGGRFNTTKPTLTDGQRGDAQLSSRGKLLATISDPDSSSDLGVEGLGGAVDNWQPSAGTLHAFGHNFGFNGVGWDRLRATTDGLRTIGANAAAGTGSWTSATANNTAVTVTTAGFATVMLSLVQTTTITGGAVTFEVDDGSGTWFPAFGVRTTANPNPVEGSYTLQASTNVAWTFDVAAFANFRVRLSPAITGTGTVTVRAVAASSVNNSIVAVESALPTGANTIGTVNAPTLTKGTQGATGLSVQNLKDSGRVNIMWTISASQPGATAETLQTVTESRDGAATATFTTKVVTSGKRLRLTSLHFAIEGGGSTPAVSRGRIRIRFNTAGAVTTGSALQAVYALSGAATAKSVTNLFVDMPDGVEYLGDGTKQVGVTIESPDWVTTTNLPVFYATIFGFEY